MGEEKTYEIPDIPIMPEDKPRIMAILAKLESPIYGTPTIKFGVKDDIYDDENGGETTSYENLEEWEEEKQWGTEEDTEYDVDDDIQDEINSAETKKINSSRYKGSRFSGDEAQNLCINNKQITEWTSEEDMAIFDCLHSGDPELISRAKTIIAQAIIVKKMTKDGGMVLISPLMEGKRLREIRRSKGSESAQACVSYLWDEIEKRIMTWLPFANGHRINISFFIRERCTKEALDKLSQDTDPKFRKRRQIREERDIAKAEAYLKEHDIKNPTLGDYREAILLFADNGKFRPREKYKLASIKKQIDRRAENGKYEHFLTPEEYAYKNLDNANKPSLDDDISDVVYAERMTEYITEQVNVECLNELHPIHRKYVMAFIKASVNCHMRREQRAAEEKRPKLAQAKSVSMAEVKKVYIEEFGGDPDISDLAFRKMVSTATREYRKARLNRILIEPQKGNSKYTTGIKLNKNFEEEDNELKDDIQYMFETGLWD